MNDYSATPARPRIGWRPTLLFWIVAAIVLFILLIAAIAGGFAGVLVFLGIIALITGLYALLFKRRTWVGLPHRKSALAVTVAGILAFMLGGMVAAGAAPSPDASTAALVTQQQSSETATARPMPTETNLAQTTCSTADESTYSGEILICTAGSDGQLVWLPEAESRKVLEAREAKAKAAAAKIAADKAAAQKAAAKAAADKLAAEKAAAKAAADKRAAEKVAAEAAAARKAAEKAAADQAAAAQAAADRAAQQAAAEQAARQAVVPVVPAAPASVYYGNCSAARAAGAAPVYAGSPGYGVHLDRDRDGVGCE